MSRYSQMGKQNSTFSLSRVLLQLVPLTLLLYSSWQTAIYGSDTTAAVIDFFPSIMHTFMTQMTTSVLEFALACGGTRNHWFCHWSTCTCCRFSAIWSQRLLGTGHKPTVLRKRGASCSAVAAIWTSACSSWRAQCVVVSVQLTRSQSAWGRKFRVFRKRCKAWKQLIWGWW